MPAVYQNLGVEFDYPDNWQVVEEETEAWPRQLSVQTPEGGFWMLQIHSLANPRELAAQTLKTMRQEYIEVEAEPITDIVEDTEIVGFEMHFYCYDFLVQARTASFETKKNSFLLLYQAEDRDFDRLEPVFKAMFVSLIRHAKQLDEMA